MLTGAASRLPVLPLLLVKTTEVTVTWIADQSSDEASLKDMGTCTVWGDAGGVDELVPPPPPPHATSAMAQATDMAERARVRDVASGCEGAWRVIVVSNVCRSGHRADAARCVEDDMVISG